MSEKGEQIVDAVSGMLPKKIVPTFIVAGFTATCLFTFCWTLAAVIDGRWVFGTNALSDLGVGMSEAARIIFNYGCVLTGVAGCIFGYGLMMHERGWLAVTGVVTMIGCIFLMGVGAVPESYQWPHMVCAGTFAGMSLIAMLTSGIGDYKKGRKKYAIFEIVLAIACVALAVIPGLFGYFEPLAIAGVLVWVFVQSYNITLSSVSSITSIRWEGSSKRITRGQSIPWMRRRIRNDPQGASAPILFFKEVFIVA